MTNKLKIDIVSDVVCPWCIVGYKRLKKAIEELGVEEQLEIEWQPFELNPKMPKVGQDIGEHISEKYGSTLEQQKASRSHLVEAGKDLGFTFDYYEGMRIVNTFEAHILLEFAKTFDKQTELKLTLMSYYFSERKNVSDRETLRQALIEVGLDAEKGMALLDDKDAQTALRKTQQFWQQAGVNSVPTIVFNRETAVTGAQPVAVFKQVLNELLAQKNV